VLLSLFGLVYFLLYICPRPYTIYFTHTWHDVRQIVGAESADQEWYTI